MEQHGSLPPPADALRESAHELQRAAGAMHKHASAFGETSTSLFTLAHVEEALDRLESALFVMAGAATESRGEHASGADEALRWHLLETARTVAAANVACASSRQWARRSPALARPRDQVTPAPAPDAIELCELEAPGAGPQRLTATVDELTLTYDVHLVSADGQATQIRSHVPSLREARAWAKAYARGARPAAIR